jgi:hypothetical protein
MFTARVLDALRSLGARIKGSGCPMDYERLLAEAGVVE